VGALQDLLERPHLLGAVEVPHIRAAAATAATAARCGLPIVRPLALLQPGDRSAWSVADAFGFGPALWVAPVLERDATEREVVLPRALDRDLERRDGRGRPGGRRRDATRADPGVGARGLDRRDVRGRGRRPRSRRGGRAEAAGRDPWGEPPLGRAAVRLAGGRRIAWSARRGWELPEGVSAA
jgi:Glycosyl hydrolases family 31